MSMMSRVLVPTLLLLVSVAACSDEDGTTPGTVTDTVPPGAVSDLVATEVSSSTALLTWTAPADDDSSGGPVAAYDLRFRVGSLDGGVWEIAHQAEDEPVPSDPGAFDSYLLLGLSEATDYAIGLRSIDDAGLPSPLSNIVFLTTDGGAPGDTVSPDPVEDLAVMEVGSTHVTLVWTATGDDGREGTASAYDLRYRLDQISEETWNLSTLAVGIPVPGPPGTREILRISDLVSETTYGFALQVLDEEPNRSGLSNRIQVKTNPRAPEFIDPRGLSGNRSNGDIYVADHGDSSIWAIGLISSPRRIAVIPGALGILRSGGGAFYATAGTEDPHSGTLWSFAAGAEPILQASGFGIPNDFVIDPSGNLIVATQRPGQIIRIGPFGGTPELLVGQEEAEFTGVSVDAAGNLYFGVLEASSSWIRKRDDLGGISDLHSPDAVSDLVDDPDARGIWYLDPQASAVILLSYDGSSIDTLATGLRSPVAIAPSPIADEAALYYSSSDGFVQRVSRETKAKRRAVQD